MILPDTVGIDISSIFLVSIIFGFKYPFIFIFLGKKKINTIILHISEAIVKRIKPHNAIVRLIFINLGITTKIIDNLIICSITLLVA